MALNASIFFFFLSDQHSVALQFQMIVRVGLRICCGLALGCLCACLAGLGQIRHICCGHTVLDLGVGNGTVLLSQVQPKLALMAKVQVAFLTLQNEKTQGS